MSAFSTVKDSSIWQRASDKDAIYRKNPFLMVGIVKRVYRNSDTSEIIYLTEVRSTNDAIEVNAKMMRRFGGAYIYEDVVYHGYNVNDLPDTTQDFAAKAGDVVIVAFLNGESREAIILGGVMHPARTSTLPINLGPQYEAEFNGVNTTINSNGEYIVTFRGIPTNAALLNNAPSKEIAPPTYDTTVGSSFMKFDKTGSFEVNDNSAQNPQNFRIDKAKGTIQVNSGAISLTMNKGSQLTTLVSKDLTGTISDAINWSTTKYTLTASKSISLNSPKIAFGKNSIELLDQLSKLIDTLGLVQVISPVGVCTPLNATPQWSGVQSIQANIKEITGSL